MGFGGGNRLQLHEITAGTPDTIVSATPDIALEMTISSAWDKLIHLGATLTLDQDMYDDALFDFLVDAVPTDLPADETAGESYENGTKSSQGSASAGYTGKRYVYGWYGGLNIAGTKRQVRIGVGYVAQESGSLTTAWQTPTKPPVIIRGMKQKAANNIAIASGFWSGTHVKTATPSPALPTQITGGTYGVEQWCEVP
jgi:hypothetical protein